MTIKWRMREQIAENAQWKIKNSLKSKIGRRILHVFVVFILNFSLFIQLGCQPKPVTPIDGLIGKIWKAKSVKEGTTVVYASGGTNNVKPGYSSFRLDLTKKDQVTLKDIDGRTLVGTWSVSTDNSRLILENLLPKPTGTVGTIEYVFLVAPTDASMHMQRTAESRKTGNTVNEYELIPE